MKGQNLSLYEKVYRELDRTYIGAERQRNVPGTSKDRYDSISEMFVDEDRKGAYIYITAANKDRLLFAEKVAKYYEAVYEILEEAWRRDINDRFKIKIYFE